MYTGSTKMQTEISSLKERMGRGGNWKEFRDEIASLHAQARTEEEHVALLQAHQDLVSVAKFAYDEQTYQQLLPIASTEYRMFLNKEAMEEGAVNPVLLDRITRREVEAGRLEFHDELRTLAVAGASVFGDTAELTAHQCKQGDWFFYGVAATALLSVGLMQV